MRRVLFFAGIIISAVLFSGCTTWYDVRYEVRSENTKHISKENAFKMVNSLRRNLDYYYTEPDEDDEYDLWIYLQATADAKEKGFPDYIYVHGRKYMNKNYTDYSVGFMRRDEEETFQIRIVRQAIESAISTAGLTKWKVYLTHSNVTLM